VAVLLASDHFEASDFIEKHELPILLEAAAAGHVKLVVIPVCRSNFAKEPFLRLGVSMVGQSGASLNALAEPVGYAFAGTVAMERVMFGVDGVATLLASPGGTEQTCPHDFRGFSRVRAA
jgi:hypothetical protein